VETSLQNRTQLTEEALRNLLNPSQFEAVTYAPGPQVVLAGAGSGKTRVLTYKIVWLIQEHGYRPHEILAVTFTNKAAREMKERVSHLLGYEAPLRWMGTLLILQFNVGKFTKAQAKQVLSICFDVAWPMLEQKFSTDGKFFWNQRLSAEIEKRQKFTESRRNNAKGHKTPKASAKHMHKHMENENRNENENEILTEYENWTDAILNRLDQHFEQMLMKESIPESPAVEHWVRDHLGLLNRYPKMRPTSQDAFRKSCMKHLRENYKKPITSNGTTRKEQDTKAAIAHVAAHYGAAEKR
jgi:superfamily I DNA/RNA helicase